MRRVGASLLAVGVGLSVAASAAAADMATYYHAGSWDAFSGRDADGRLVCGIGNTNPTDGRRFTLRFVIGGDAVNFIASKPNWNIPADTQATVVMQVGLDTPWPQQATGQEHELRWTLDRTAIQSFDAQFRRAGSMTLTFPQGSEPPWTVPLSGSTAISNAFGRCITDLTRRAGNTPAVPAPAPVDQGPTQPFGAPATQPIAPR